MSKQIFSTLCDESLAGPNAGREQVTLVRKGPGEVQEDKPGHWAQARGDRRLSRQGKHRGHEVTGDRLNIHTERRQGCSGRQCPD